MKRKYWAYCCLFALRFVRNGRLRRWFEKKLANASGGHAYSKLLRNYYERYYGVKIGYGTYGGCWHNQSIIAGGGRISIGNYCSIANGNISLKN